MSVASCDRIKPEIPLTPFKALKNLLSIDDIAAPASSRRHFRQAFCLSVEIRTLELFSWRKRTHTHIHTFTQVLPPPPLTSMQPQKEMLAALIGFLIRIFIKIFIKLYQKLFPSFFNP